MAVKPSTQPLLWASDAVYTTGPFIGQPQKAVPPAGVAAEGHRPGELFPTAAEHENSQQNRTTGLVRWLFLGSSAGAADAHVLESDANGEGQVERWRVVPANPHSYALLVQAPPGAGFAIQATGASALGDATIIGETTGSGAAFEALAATAGASFLSTRSGSGNGVEITHTGSGNAARLDASGGTGVALMTFGGTTTTAAVITGGAGQAAMLATAGNNGAVAAQFLGTGTGLGIVATGGATSANATGVRGDGLHADAMGVHGRTSTSASTTAAGVHGEARGSGATGVFANGGTVGRGLMVQADASSPGYSAMRIVPQDADPTSATNDGEVIWHGSHRTLRTCVAGYGYRSVMAMGPGSALYIAESQAYDTAEPVTGAPNTLLTLNCVEAEGTGVFDGAVQIVFSCDVRSTAGTATYLSITVNDITNTVTIADYGAGATTDPDGPFLLGIATAEWQRSITFGVKYDPGMGNYGDLTVEIVATASPTNVEVRNATATIVGVV